MRCQVLAAFAASQPKSLHVCARLLCDHHNAVHTHGMLHLCCIFTMHIGYDLYMHYCTGGGALVVLGAYLALPLPSRSCAQLSWG